MSVIKEEQCKREAAKPKRQRVFVQSYKNKKIYKMPANKSRKRGRHMFQKKKKYNKTNPTLTDIYSPAFEICKISHDISQEESKKKKASEIEVAQQEIKEAVEKIKKREKISFFKRIFQRKPEENRTFMPKKSSFVKKGDFFGEDSKSVDVSSITQKIKNARASLANFDLKAARQQYMDVIDAYNKLKPHEKKKVYVEIRELYFERKSAEGIKA